MAAPVRARLGESVAAARGPKKVRFIALMARVVFSVFFYDGPRRFFLIFVGKSDVEIWMPSLVGNRHVSGESFGSC